MTINLQLVLHIIQYDNKSAINIHFIKEKLDSGLTCTPYVSINHQLADILTKSLSSIKFQASVSKLGMKHIYSPLKRECGRMKLGKSSFCKEN